MKTRTFIFFFTLLLVLSAGAPSLADRIKISVSGGYEEIQSFKKNNVVYYSLSELAEILGGQLDWELIGHRVRYTEDNFRFDFLIDAAYFKLDDSVFNLVYPVIYNKGQLFVPAETFTPFLDGVTVQKISWDSDARMLRVEPEYFNVTDFAISSKANGILIEVFLTSALNYDIFVTEGNWINISIPGARINSPRILSRRDPRFMYKMNVHQIGNTGQISVRLKRNITKWNHMLVFNPPRIQMSIPDINFELDPADTSPVIGPDNKIDVIVIDPGHGGKDYGAIGQQGTREKDIVLNIARELAKIIRKDKQFKVIMTRDRDIYVSLEERAEIANKAGADLFISIHANASPKKNICGWNVFFLAPAKNDSARAVAQLENSFFLRELSAGSNNPEDNEEDTYNDPVVSILNEMIMTEFQAESHDFAMMVDREFRRSLKIPARGVDQAGFFVLNKVFTPSVLVEAAFISNKNEEKILNNKDYHKQVAEGIYQAIKRFKAKYENQ
ncbi:MAG: N-acetylmuramoyl-L-alanine amidase [candidate division Zixibacteria bacterium]|nr:N-acetylmuramoyl-L-alanine amidase [candidate division Zixibacteria bacterium]